MSDDACAEERRDLFVYYLELLELTAMAEDLYEEAEAAMDAAFQARDAGDRDLAAAWWGRVVARVEVANAISKLMQEAEKRMYDQWRDYLDCRHAAATGIPTP